MTGAITSLLTLYAISRHIRTSCLRHFQVARQLRPQLKRNGGFRNQLALGTLNILAATGPIETSVLKRHNPHRDGKDAKKCCALPLF